MERKSIILATTIGILSLNTQVLAKGTRDIYINNQKAIPKEQVEVLNNHNLISITDLAEKLNLKYEKDIINNHPRTNGRVVTYELTTPDNKIQLRFTPQFKIIGKQVSEGKYDVYSEKDFTQFKEKDGKLYINLQVVENDLKIPVTYTQQGINIGNSDLKDILNSKEQYPYMTKDELIEYMKTTRRKTLDDFDDIETILKQVNTTLKTIPLQGKTDKQKLKLIAEKVVAQVDYDYIAYKNSKEYPEAYAITGVVNNKKVTCSGYAEYYYLLCRAAGLDVKIVKGKVGNGDHAWNVIYDNGKRYNIDVTFMDGKKVDYRYFYKTDQEFKKLNHTLDYEY